MRTGIVIGGVGVVVIAGLCAFAPLFDGYSVMYLGEQCRMIQPEAGLLATPGDEDSRFCGSVQLFTLAVSAFGAFGAIVVAIGVIVRRRPKADTIDQQ